MNIEPPGPLRPSASGTGPRRSLQKRLYGSRAAQALLQRNGLLDLDAVFSREGRVEQRHAGRSVLETLLTTESGKSVRTFIKLYRGRRRLWPRMTDIKTGQVFHSLAALEWQGLQRLESIGLRVPERLALLREGLWTSRAAVVLREVPAPCSIDELIGSGVWGRLPPEHRDRVLDAALAAMQRIHAAGLGWRGASSRHFFPQRREDGGWTVWLIDCEGVHGRATRKTIARDYRRLQRSMRESGADAATLELLKHKIARVRAPQRRAP